MASLPTFKFWVKVVEYHKRKANKQLEALNNKISKGNSSCDIMAQKAKLENTIFVYDKLLEFVNKLVDMYSNKKPIKPD